MGESQPLPRRRDLRNRKSAETAPGLSFPTATAEDSPSGADLPVYAAGGSDRPAFRGSDGSVIKAHRRKRLIGVSAVSFVVVAGAALAAVVLSNNAVASPDSQVTTYDQVAQAARHADRVDLKPQAVDAGNGDEANTAGKSGGGALVAGKQSGDAEAASKLVVKKVLPGCNPKPPTGKATNGELPASWLCKIGVGSHKLRRDAAVSFARMNAAYKEDTGKSMKVTDSYRTMDSQVSVASRKPGFAAQPGTSMHGWGIALDMAGGVPDMSGTQWDWLQKNAKKYGWENPDWAQRNNYEPWHWEYVPARKQIKGQ